MSHRDPEGGAAVVEFVMISVLLVFLLFAVLQVAALFYVRNVVAAAVADGARYAADADVDPDDGAQRAHLLISQGASAAVSRGLTCSGDLETRDGMQFSRVRCTGPIRAFFLPVGRLDDLDLTAHSVKEQR